MAVEPQRLCARGSSPRSWPPRARRRPRRRAPRPGRSGSVRCADRAAALPRKGRPPAGRPPSPYARGPGRFAHSADRAARRWRRNRARPHGDRASVAGAPSTATASGLSSRDRAVADGSRRRSALAPSASASFGKVRQAYRRRLRRGRSRGVGHSSCAPAPPGRPRSGGDRLALDRRRSGCQTSKMKTTRSSSLGLAPHARSCRRTRTPRPRCQSRGFGADPEPAAVGHDQRQVADQPRIVDPDMRRDRGVRARAARTSHWARRRRMSGCGNAVKQRHRLRAMARIGLDPLARSDQVDRGPVAVAVERPPLIERLVLGILDVGHQLGALGGHHRLEFGGDRHRSRLRAARATGTAARGWNSRSPGPG